VKRPFALLIAALLVRSPAAAQSPAPHGFTRQQIETGAELYAVNCSPCHGARLQDPQGAFDLKTFPRDQRERFVNSVVKGKNQMPAFGDLFKPEALEALWAYVVAGERK
jgi:mono/diheme cytochrome c family protein